MVLCWAVSVCSGHSPGGRRHPAHGGLRYGSWDGCRVFSGIRAFIIILATTRRIRGLCLVVPGVPVILQLLIWFNLALIFPHVLIPGVGTLRTVDIMTPFLSALLGLGLNQAAYIAEIFRAGFQSIDAGQYEAASAIGMTRFKAMKRIILPQAFRTVIPPLGNEFINMIKLTSLASVIQYPEVLHNAENIYYANTRVIELLIVAGFWCLLAVTILSPLQHLLERHFAKGKR